MAVTQFAAKNVQVYLGVAADAKPTLALNGVGGPQPGDRFYETDTFKLFIWNGASWVQISATTATAMVGI